MEGRRLVREQVRSTEYLVGKLHGIGMAASHGCHPGDNNNSNRQPAKTRSDSGSSGSGSSSGGSTAAAILRSACVQCFQSYVSVQSANKEMRCRAWALRGFGGGINPHRTFSSHFATSQSGGPVLHASWEPPGTPTRPFSCWHAGCLAIRANLAGLAGPIARCQSPGLAPGLGGRGYIERQFGHWTGVAGVTTLTR